MEVGNKSKRLSIKKQSIDSYISIITIVMLVILPVFIYTAQVWTISPKILEGVYATGLKKELYNYYKSIILYILTILVTILFLFKLKVDNYYFRDKKLSIYIGLLLFSVNTSMIISEYKYISLIGNTERFEGALAWICYCIIFFVLYSVKISKNKYKYFYYAMISFLTINTILGLLDFYNIDILKIQCIPYIIGSGGKLGGRLMTTLYNPNFSSGLAGCIFVVSTIYLMLEKNNKRKILILLCSMLSFTVVLVSLSLSGFLTLIVLSPIAISISTKYEQRKNIIKWSLILIISNALVFVILYSHNNRVYNETLGFFERVININSESLNIWNKDDEETTAFEKLDSLSTGRMHIWKQTLKLIKERPIFGYGFDTFPYTINHDDIENGNVFIDKPHNWYLTVWYGCGILGLVGLLGIIIWIVVETIKLYIKGIDNKMLYITVFGVISYAFQGLFNDSFIGTSIFFWIYAGLCANIIISYKIDR